MAGLRFCAYQYPHLPLDALRGRWRDAERSGFDVLWNCDTVVEPDRPRHTMFDGPATLTMMAADPTRIRVIDVGHQLVLPPAGPVRQGVHDGRSPQRRTGGTGAGGG